ncbi:MAG: hypothetical protein ACPGWR_14560 [Ardenticatenaceae bacterium]
MAKQFAHIYIHSDSAGNQAACSRVYEQAKGVVRRLFDEKQAEGYRLFVIEDEEDADNSLISFAPKGHDICDYDEVTGGRFPFLYSQLQPAEHVTLDLDAMMKRMCFKRCA